MSSLKIEVQQSGSEFFWRVGGQEPVGPFPNKDRALDAALESIAKNLTIFIPSAKAGS